MVFQGLQFQEDRIEGVVDVGLLVIAHFENPAKDHAIDFLEKALLWKKKYLIPNSVFLGAYHILTNYLRVERTAAFHTLKKTLETKSPAFFADINTELTIEGLTNALGYRIESWDGYIIAIAKAYMAPMIFTIDGGMKNKVKDLQIINPIPEDVFKEYNDWLEKRLKN